MFLFIILYNNFIAALQGFVVSFTTKPVRSLRRYEHEKEQTIDPL